MLTDALIPKPLTFLPAGAGGGAAAPLAMSDLAEHRAAMLRFARRKIRDADLAEDAVQEALAAAIASRGSFQGQSALRTWLIGILNHKIQDAFRRESRYVRPDAGEDRGDGDSTGEGFDRLARLEAPDDDVRTDPVQAVAQRRMRERLVAEIEALPPTLKDVFTLQALEGVETGEVCRRLSITEANCWVRLHRARKRLAERMRDHLG
jgi:RNA polymerase sigma-70 factor (ECF subfamily)